MTDLIDKAAEVEELLRMEALGKQQASVRLVATGCCLNCDEPLQPGALFCDADCTHDYERRQSAERRNGKGERQHGITE